MPRRRLTEEEKRISRAKRLEKKRQYNNELRANPEYRSQRAESMKIYRKRKKILNHFSNNVMPKRRLTEEAKQKMRQSNKERRSNPEYRAKEAESKRIYRKRKNIESFVEDIKRLKIINEYASTIISQKWTNVEDKFILEDQNDQHENNN